GGQMMGALPFLDPFLTRDQVRLLKKDNVVTQDDPAIATLETLCITPTSVEAILPSYMVQYRKHGQFTEDQAA
ncbi:MAG: complex I NDUFA9 subunit family protein, partial [Pseudomonadota bacterium]